MGLFGRKKHSGVRGTARVVSCTRPPQGVMYGPLSMNLVVEAAGIPAYSHQYKKRAAQILGQAGVDGT